ncbi:uncharacterized protein B0H18DRAFT_1025301 [Fomitopsis serialis]|uniref:uncharacterized protein n=1 Tax=Fomitopsis serialis TaxID=139415 RepID=UPI002007B0B7|nr:uncharacterized protein B0H18DRAFT_1025301 [Neoantrodia serialis]KAH9920142.1 hypothetical protein B0H18DRAFT_1025301 [Neoantrodia serialis]
MTATTSADTPVAQLDHLHGGYFASEIFWRDRQPWLQERGYLLRPRYRPNWKPSWRGTRKHFGFCEDGISPLVGAVMDATCLSDGSVVSLKRIDTTVNPFELEIGQFLSSEVITSDPRSRCVPLLDILTEPTEPTVSMIVMPLLRRFDDPRFLTVGEAVAFFKQLIEGLRVMHEHNVAHRDISSVNVMMDARPMYPDMWHPQSTSRRPDYSGQAEHYSRTERPPKYLYIDYGLSRKYSAEDVPPQELPIFGGDKSVPEFQEDGYDKPANPFHTDIYYLGNLIRTQFVQKYCGFGFMQSLVDDMVQDDPGKRPTIEEVDSRFDKIYNRLPWWKLRSRVVEQDESGFLRTVSGIGHVFRTARYVAKRLPSVPMPS